MACGPIEARSFIIPAHSVNEEVTDVLLQVVQEAILPPVAPVLAYHVRHRRICLLLDLPAKLNV